MTKTFLLVVAIIGAASAMLGCRGSGEKACSSSSDGVGTDLGAGDEASQCRSDDDYHVAISYHMSTARVISVRDLEILRGWAHEGDAGEMINRLLSEDGTILHENRSYDPALCAGENCGPGPREVDDWELIRMVPGAAIYELTDTVSGNPPIRIDLRGHVQLLCMRAPCGLDVCKPSPLDAGSPQ